MANHKSAIKSHRVSLRNKERNMQKSSRIKTFIGKVEKCVQEADRESAVQMLRLAEAEIRKGVSYGLFKLNNASRRISQLTKKVKALETQSSSN